MKRSWFSMMELTHTSTGIANDPPPAAQENLRRLRDDVLDPLREVWGGPIQVTSGYRSMQVNRRVGGSESSKHLVGLAADIRPAHGLARDMADLIISVGLPVQELILYEDDNRLHVATYNEQREVMECVIDKGVKKYIPMT